MSKNHQPVPRLDLAPKLERPLSLWNPLDYLRLLYWVFFFPQAVPWYVDKFGDGFIFYPKVNWLKGWNFLRKNPIEFQLLLQGLSLIVFTHLILRVIFQIAGIPIEGFNLWLVLIVNIIACVTSALGLGVAPGVTIAVAFAPMFLISDVARELAIALVSALPPDIGNQVILERAIAAIIRGICWAILFNTILCLATSVGNRQKEEMLNKLGEAPIKAPKPLNLKDFLPIIISFAIWTGWGGLWPKILLGDVVGILKYVVLLVTSFGIGCIAGVITFLRPENWLFGLPWVMRSLPNKYQKLPRVTPIPVPNLSNQLKTWLRSDWETGLENANQLLAYTFQFCPVIKAVNRVLEEIPPEQVVFRVAQLAKNPHRWRLVYAASATLSQTIKLTKSETRLDTLPHAAAAGFWYLHQKEPNKATEAFALVRCLPYGEEMFVLAQTLATLHQPTQLATIANLELPPQPTEPLLRPTTWEAIKSFQRVIADTRIIIRSPSRSARSLALNRAQGELKNILDNIETIPQAERELIKEIAQTWQKALLELTAEVGQVNITEPVNNPYTIGDPVVGKKFVGREDIIRDLTELWILTDRPQSIVLYGHRRMGKTSILLNIANLLGAKVKLAYINLLRIGSNPQNVGEVLIAITDAIAKEVNLEPPADRDLLDLPYRNFERYLNRVISNIDGSLIVALDEFEKIETLIANQKIPPDFMGFLRGMVQMNPKLAFALAGLHTLEEMTQDYFDPFFASIIPIRVGFMTPGATRQILANPGDEDFLLDYEPETLDRIYELTHGQPYLVQLVGFLLVRRYNELTFETGRPQKPIFTKEDVEAVIDNHNFYSHGRYYFTGVWDQAAQGAKGQQKILTALAPHQKEGLTLAALGDATGIDTPEMQTALETLERHDVVKENDNRWQIAVELLRRWLLLR